MITVIASTNRTNSYTEAVAAIYCELLNAGGATASLLSLTRLPADFLASDLYGQRSQAMQEILDQYIEPASKYVWVLPEYNGSFPGVAKVFVDAVPPRFFRNKKAALIGVASGRAGNLRGTDQFTAIMNYLKVFVHYSKPKLSGIEHVMDDTFKIVDEATCNVLKEHARLVLDF